MKEGIYIPFYRLKKKKPAQLFYNIPSDTEVER